MQILALSCIISASATLNKFEKLDSPQLVLNTKAAAGWALFLSLAVLLYQIFAVLQLFLYLKFLYMKIPVGKSLWYLFPLIVRLVVISV